MQVFKPKKRNLNNHSLISPKYFFKKSTSLVLGALMLGGSLLYKPKNATAHILPENQPHFHLTWDRNTQQDTRGYTIFRSTNPNGAFKYIGYILQPASGSRVEYIDDSTDLEKNTTYYYGVRTYNSREESDLSAIVSLNFSSVQQDTIPPELSVDEIPTFTTNPELVVTGKASDENLLEVFVNKEKADLKFDGSFYINLNLKEGDNIIEVVAKDSNNNNQIYITNIELDKPPIIDINSIEIKHTLSGAMIKFGYIDSGLVSASISVNDGQPKDLSLDINSMVKGIIPELQNGSNNITIYLRDQHTTTTQSLEVIVTNHLKQIWSPSGYTSDEEAMVDWKPYLDADIVSLINDKKNQFLSFVFAPNKSLNYDKGYWDKDFSQWDTKDLSDCKLFSIDLKVPEKNSVLKFFKVYFKSYGDTKGLFDGQNLFSNSNQQIPYYFGIERIEGTPPGMDNITGLRLAGWEKTEENTSLNVGNLIGYQDIKIIDDYRAYNYNYLARRAYKPGMDADPVSLGPSNMSKGDRMLWLNVREGSRNRAFWDLVLPKLIDLSNYDVLPVLLYVKDQNDLSKINSFNLYFNSSDGLKYGWYKTPNIRGTDLQPGLNSFLFEKKDFIIEKDPPGWKYIKRIRHSIYKKPGSKSFSIGMENKFFLINMVDYKIIRK
jgi:hypothetical protein